MGTVALLEDEQKSRALYLGSRELPENYMEDFSLIGFLVDDITRARELLRYNGYDLTGQPGGADIRIRSSECLTRIESILVRNNIRCTLADIADTVYQA